MKILKNLKTSLKNPIVALSISVSVSVLLYYSALSEMKPSYTVSDSEIVASKKDGIKKLNILYDNQVIENAFRKKIVIWNSGNKTIYKNFISSDHPIRIKYSSNVSILDQRVSKTSRPDLKFTSEIDSIYGNSINIILLGDEALESDDGVMIEIFYSGLEDEEFYVTGRIKGVKQGFEEYDWDRVVKKNFDFQEWSEFIPMLFIIFIGAVMYYVEIRRFRAGEKNNLLFASFIFPPALLLTVYLIMPFFIGVNWVQ